MKKILLAVLIAGSLISAQAQSYNYSINFTDQGEVNPSPGTGSGTASYNSATHLLTLHAVFSGLQGTTTAAHIHAATAVSFTGNAGVATTTPSLVGFPLGVTSGSFSNTLNLTLASSWNPAYITAHGGSITQAETDFIAAVNAGQASWNIHSTFTTSGEIRGFLTRLPPPTLTNAAIQPNGSFQFSFTSAAGAPFTVLGSTNVALPLASWSVLGAPAETTPGQFRFNDPQATNGGQRFYRVRSP